ncbi:MAG: hypothetical protein VXZ49_10985, partial [Planctomycetota bacterium]|nr:hypothetical protein [Planctomycetota bacterium]
QSIGSHGQRHRWSRVEVGTPMVSWLAPFFCKAEDHQNLVGQFLKIPAAFASIVTETLVVRRCPVPYNQGMSP